MKNIHQLDIDDLQGIEKYMFSIANGNHILRYTEKEYRNFIKEDPAIICQLLIYRYASDNWGYDDPRMFDNYDEQWLASKVDTGFISELNFDLDDFKYDKLLPYQKTVIDFTKSIIPTIQDWNYWLKTGTPLERVYSVLANNLDIHQTNGEVLNKQHAIHRGMDMVKSILDGKYQPEVPFEPWELKIY